MDSTKFKLNLSEDLNRHLVGTIDELQESERNNGLNRLKRNIRKGDYVVVPMEGNWANEVRGKRGLITDIEDGGLRVKFGDDNRSWTVTWQTIYDNDLIVFNNNSMKPFQFC